MCGPQRQWGCHAEAVACSGECTVWAVVCGGVRECGGSHGRTHNCPPKQWDPGATFRLHAWGTNISGPLFVGGTLRPCFLNMVSLGIPSARRVLQRCSQIRDCHAHMQAPVWNLDRGHIFLAISLGDAADYANFLGFWGSVLLLPHLCPLSVPEVGVCGVYSESP